MNVIEAIASRHLGKAGDGTVVAPYQTPDSIDPSLLVGVPRSLNREQYGIEEGALPFIGVDVWNCYEVSALVSNGYPFSGVLKISYSADSLCIVESKSLKLYLNSFNMAVVANNERDAADAVKNRVRKDLSALLNTKVDVGLSPYNSYKGGEPVSDYVVIEHSAYLDGITFNVYNETPELLQTYATPGRSKAQRITTNALRSNCRVTNQPDWGDVFIYIDGPRHLVESSVLQYIVSMRRENHFHEEIVECIFKRLVDLLPKGTDIAVGALYTRRGGIDINPIRATTFGAMKDFERITNVMQPSPKTSRQ